MSEHSFMSCSVMSDSDEEQRILDQRQQERYKKLEHAKAWPDYDLKNFSWEETDRVFREERIRQKERKRSKEHWLRLCRLIDQEEPCPFLVTELEPEDVVERMPVGTWTNGFPFCYKSLAEMKADNFYKCRQARKETEEFKAKLLTAECKASEAARQGVKNAARMKKLEEKHQAVLKERDEAKQRFEEVEWEFAHSDRRCQEIRDHHGEAVDKQDQQVLDKLEFLEEKNEELEEEMCQKQGQIAELEERHARGPTIMKEQVKALRKVCQNLKIETKEKKKTIKELMGKIKAAGIDMEEVAQRVAVKKEALLKPEQPIERIVEKRKDPVKRNPLLWEAQVKTKKGNLDGEISLEKETSETAETEIEAKVTEDTERQESDQLEKNGSGNSCQENMEGIEKAGDGEDLVEGPLPYYVGTKFGQVLGLDTARGKNIRVDYGLYYFHGENVPPFMQNKNKDKIWYVSTNSDGEEEIEIESMKTTVTTSSKGPTRQKLNSKKSVDENACHGKAIEKSPAKSEEDEKSSGGDFDKECEVTPSIAESTGTSSGEESPKLQSEGGSKKFSSNKSSPRWEDSSKNSSSKESSPRSQDSGKKSSSKKSSPRSQDSGKKSSFKKSSSKLEDSSEKSSLKKSARRHKSVNRALVWKPTSALPTPPTSPNGKEPEARIKARPAPKHTKPFIPKKSAKPVTVPKEKLMWCEWRSKTREAVFDEYRKDREYYEECRYEEELRQEQQARIEEKKERRAKQFKARPVPDFSKPFVPKLPGTQVWGRAPFLHTSDQARF